MTSIEFGKMCHPYNVRYRELFGYVPCRDDYRCSQDEYFEALKKAIESKREIGSFVPRMDLSLETIAVRYGFALEDGYYKGVMNGIAVQISEENFSEGTAAYAHQAVRMFVREKEKVLDYVIADIADCYSGWFSVEEIRDRMGEPYLEVLADGWGSLVWLNHRLDEHIIECEFGKDMQLSYVTMNG